MITLMPQICEKNGSTIPITKAVQHPALEQLPDRAAFQGERLLDLPHLPRGVVVPVDSRKNRSVPLSDRPCFVSHRGLSGTKNSSTNSIAAGNTPANNIPATLHRQRSIARRRRRTSRVRSAQEGNRVIREDTP